MTYPRARGNNDDTLIHNLVHLDCPVVDQLVLIQKRREQAQRTTIVYKEFTGSLHKKIVTYYIII